MQFFQDLIFKESFCSIENLSMFYLHYQKEKNFDKRQPWMENNFCCNTTSLELSLDTLTYLHSELNELKIRRCSNSLIVPLFSKNAKTFNIKEMLDRYEKVIGMKSVF